MDEDVLENAANPDTRRLLYRREYEERAGPKQTYLNDNLDKICSFIINFL